MWVDLRSHDAPVVPLYLEFFSQGYRTAAHVTTSGDVYIQPPRTADTFPRMQRGPAGDHHHAVIQWKHFPRYGPFVRGILRSPVNSPHQGQWRGALMFSLICAWINGWLNNRGAGDFRRHCAHYDVTVIIMGDTVYEVNLFYYLSYCIYINETGISRSNLLETPPFCYAF